MVLDTGLSCSPGERVEEYRVSICGAEATLYVAGGADEYVVEAETRVDERVVCNAELAGEWVWGSTRYTRWENRRPVASIACIRAPLRLERTGHIIGCAGAPLDEYEEKYLEASALLAPALYNTYIVLEGIDEASALPMAKRYLLAPLAGPKGFSWALAYSPLIQHGLHGHGSAHVFAGELYRLLTYRPSAIPPWLMRRILAEPGMLSRVLYATLISKVELAGDTLRIRAMAGSLIGIRVGEDLVIYMRIRGGQEAVAVHGGLRRGGIKYIVYPHISFSGEQGSAL